MKWLKKLFGVKDKVEEKPNKSYIPKDFELEERKISPLLTPDDKSVPNVPIENIMEIHQPEEPIAPTLERWDDDYIEKRKAAYEFNKRAIEDLKEGDVETYFSIEKLNDVYKKFPKPKKQAKKKDNFNDDASKPKGRNFLM